MSIAVSYSTTCWRTLCLMQYAGDAAVGKNTWQLSGRQMLRFIMQLPILQATDLRSR